MISVVSRPKFTILWGHLEDILLLNKFFFRLSIHALVAKLYVDVDVDGVYERRPRPLCPPHLSTLRFKYMLIFFI